jgi:hydrogenase small subunit
MYTRRQFFNLCAKTTLALSLSELLLTDLGQAVAANQIKKPTVLWLELGSCTGDTISLENSATPNIKELLSKVINLKYHWVLQNVDAEHSMSVLTQIEKEESGEFILVVEGSVMLADQGRWDYVGYENGKLITGLEMLKRLAPQARHIIAIGTCAAFGGPSATHPNLSKSVGVMDVVKQQVINTPGCPCHPDWFVGTLFHLIHYGIPQLDAYNRPKLFYGRTIHDQCQRRTYFEKGIFAKNIGEPWCMFTVGCRGPRTFADCPNREWNEADNWPVGCNTPCIGCVEPGFPDIAMPFFQRYPDLKLPGLSANMDKAALALGLVTTAGLGVHLGISLASRRLRRNLTETSLPLNPPAPRTLAQEQGIKPEQELGITLEQKKSTRPKRIRRTLVK